MARIVLGVGGSVAAYKAADLCSKLVQRQHEVIALRRRRNHAGIPGGIDDAARASKHLRTILQFFKECRDGSVGRVKVDYQSWAVAARSVASAALTTACRSSCP